MKKLIVFESLLICLLMLLIPSTSAIDFQLSNKTDTIKSSNFYNESVKPNENSKITYEKKSTHVLVPGDGDKKYYAIITGCTEYKDSIHNLPPFGKPFPESTMKYVYNVLLNASNWEEENIVLLLNEESTKQNILDSFNNMGNLIDGDDVFFFSWTGHGTQVEDIDGDEVDGKDEAICPYDTDVKWDGFVNIITDDELDSYFSMIGAEGLFIMFESCMSGGLVDNETEHNYSFVDVNEDRRVVVMSSLPDKKCYLMYNIGYPMLMLYGIAFSNDSCDIDHNGWISAEEAFMYVDEAYPSLEHDYYLDVVNQLVIPLSTISVFIFFNSILKKLKIKPELRFIISTLVTGYAYNIYQQMDKEEMIKDMINDLIKRGAENNPNICDDYFSELNIIKID